eukprot:COSAG04_NODE_891_length_9607_cov_13.087085_16_plen_156_part_00
MAAGLAASRISAFAPCQLCYIVACVLSASLSPCSAASAFMSAFRVSCALCSYHESDGPLTTATAVQEQQAAHKASLAAAESALRKAEAATASAEGAASAANDAMEGAAATAMASIQQAALSAATDAGTAQARWPGLLCFALLCCGHRRGLSLRPV